MIEAVVTHYLGFSIISFILKILIGYVAKKRSKSPPFLCHTDVTQNHNENSFKIAVPDWGLQFLKLSRCVNATR